MVMTTPNTVSPTPKPRAQGEILPTGTRVFTYRSPTRGTTVEVRITDSLPDGCAMTPENDRLALEAEEAAITQTILQAIVVRELSFIAYGHAASGEPRVTATAAAHAEYVGALVDCLTQNSARVALMLAQQTLDTSEREQVRQMCAMGMDPRVILAVIVEMKRGG